MCRSWCIAACCSEARCPFGHFMLLRGAQKRSRAVFFCAPALTRKQTSCCLDGLTRLDGMLPALLQMRPQVLQVCVSLCHQTQHTCHKVSHLLGYPEDGFPMQVLTLLGWTGCRLMLLAHLGWMLRIYAQARWTPCLTCCQVVYTDSAERQS